MLALIGFIALCCAARGSAAPTPARTPHPTRIRPLGVSRLSTSTHLPKRGQMKVSAAACNRRTVAVNPPSNQLGPQGASSSRTLVAVPLNGNVASATRNDELAEICAHVRH